jgi:hypothetical protein
MLGMARRCEAKLGPAMRGMARFLLLIGEVHMSYDETIITEVQRIRRALESIAISMAGMNDIAAREVWYRPTPRPVVTPGTNPVAPVAPVGEDDGGES